VQGHAAIYSANLLTIAATLKGELVFEEDKFRTFPDEARPWDRMTHLWRSWFSLRVLANLGAVVTARRDGNHVVIRAKQQIEDVSSIEAGIERLHTAASGLGDHLLLGLSGYFLADPPRSVGPSLDEVDEYLKGEGYSIAPFTKFRRIPFEHGASAAEHLMSIALDEPIANWEVWLRAIWILTTEPVRTVSWADIGMVRELKHLTEPLIAGTASPADSEAFFDEHSATPSQLLFARRSGGRARYKDTYQRVLVNEASAHWTLDEQAMVLQAALYFNDAATATRLGKEIRKFTFSAFQKLMSWRALFRPGAYGAQFQMIRAISEPLYELIDSDAATSKATPLAMLAFAGGKSIVAVSGLSRLKTLTSWLSHFREPQPNPYLAGYARYLRSASLEPTEAAPALRHLATCVDLPADVRIELLELARKLNPSAEPKVAAHLEFPMAALDDIPLASVAAARRVAHWMGRKDALDAIEERLAGIPPAATTS
jgi:hypothetical protein